MKHTIKLIPAAFAAFSLVSCNETQEKETPAETSTPQEEEKAPIAEVVPDPPEEIKAPETTEEEEPNNGGLNLDMAKQMAAELLKSKGGDKGEMLGALLENAKGLDLEGKAKEMGIDLKSLLNATDNLTDEQKAKIEAAKAQIFDQINNMSAEDKAKMLEQGKGLMEALLNQAKGSTEEETEENE